MGSAETLYCCRSPCGNGRELPRRSFGTPSEVLRKSYGSPTEQMACPTLLPRYPLSVSSVTPGQPFGHFWAAPTASRTVGPKRERSAAAKWSTGRLGGSRNTCGALERPTSSEYPAG